MLAGLWFLIIGGLLITMVLAGTIVKRLPLSSSLLYLGVGFALGAHGFKLFYVDPIGQSALLERLAEIAVLLSLFSTGLKLSASFKDNRWVVPLRLATSSMVITVGLITLVGVTALHLPLGAAILLGGILAPTDPVLAADVQVAHLQDRDRLRFALTGEAGMNDGTAGPFVLLGLGLLGLHPLGTWGWRWLVVDVLWAVVGGIGLGWIFGLVIGQIVLYLRRRHQEALGLDEFLGLGLVALTYGASILTHAFGFLAVFTAGLAFRRSEKNNAQPMSPLDGKLATQLSSEEIATTPEHAGAYMMHAVLGFNEQLERLVEVSLVLIVAGALTSNLIPRAAGWFVPLLLLVIRPASVLLGVSSARAPGLARSMMAWFGIRGIGSVYYLMFAIQQGLPRPLAEKLIGLTLTTIAASILVHGMSVTPLMNYYTRVNDYLRRRRRRHVPV